MSRFLTLPPFGTLRQSILPFAAAWVLASAAAIGALMWSVSEVDRISRQRDDALVSVIIKQSMDNVSHIQESTTYWDDAVVKVATRPLDNSWLDNHLGTWFNEYAGHDEVYMVADGGVPLYAMRDGERVDPRAYRQVEALIAPLIAELRATNEISEPLELDVAAITPGVVDLVEMHGHPAIVSVKPFSSDTGDLADHPGTKSVHVSVLYLDQRFLNGMAKQYGFAGARISDSAIPGPGEELLALRNRQGKAITYMMWMPFEPGGSVLGKVLPVLLGLLLGFGALIVLLVRRLERKSRALEHSEAQAQYRALHDPLTGLCNRAMFERTLPEILGQSRVKSDVVALLFVDIDHFKQVNDQFGHAAGDLLIREVGNRLSGEVRVDDTVFRLGGDEFAVIINNPGSVDLVDRICDRIVRAIEAPFNLMGAHAHVGASVGVALWPDHAADHSSLARKADIALYRAKAAGRGRHVFFKPEMDEEISQRADFNREMRRAMTQCEQQLEVVYQPILSARDNTITAVEALLRWHHPERGILTPTAFGQFAEESGLIAALGDWVLTTAARDVLQWPGLRLAVNVSPLQVRQRGFPDRVQNILGAEGLSPARLELELTESALLINSGEVPATIKRLRAAGIAIALDDFGTGFSSLSHIRDIEVDRIKIDRSFITGTDSSSGMALVHGIVTMASGFGLRVTAEGVESRRQGELVRSLGCDEVQGYLYSRPLPADEITKLLRSRQQSGKSAKVA